MLLLKEKHDHLQDLAMLRQEHQRELESLTKNDSAQELVIQNMRKMHEQELNIIKNELSGYKYIKGIEY